MAYSWDWLSSEDFDLDDWLNPDSEDFDLNDWLNSNSQDFDLSDWLNSDSYDPTPTTQTRAPGHGHGSSHAANPAAGNNNAHQAGRTSQPRTQNQTLAPLPDNHFDSPEWQRQLRLAEGVELEGLPSPGPSSHAGPPTHRQPPRPAQPAQRGPNPTSRSRPNPRDETAAAAARGRAAAEALWTQAAVEREKRAVEEFKVVDEFRRMFKK